MGAPTYAQLEKLAYEIYKRPLALFFLPVPPDEPKPRTEFRSLPQVELGRLSRDTTLLIRKGRAFQAALVELYGDRSPVAKPIWREIHVSHSHDVVSQATNLRSLLGVDIESVRLLPDADAGLKLWRRAIEKVGIHVFKESFEQKEYSGFCLWHPEFPVIVINNSTTKTRQVFSLIHELAHILFDKSGISRFDDVSINELPQADRIVERFCNALAAEVLLPSADFQSASRGFEPNRATDQQFADLANRYHVSRSVVLRRFLDRDEVSLDFYLAKDREWLEQRKEKSQGGSYYSTQGVYLSERFMQEVVSRYSRRLLTKAEAAEMIGVKPRNFEGIEDMVLRGNAA